MHASYDVAVLGAGPAGAATALFLRQRTSLSVILVAHGVPSDSRLGESLSPAARRMLTTLGLWDAFVRDGHLLSRGTCSCWGSRTPGYNDYLYSPWGPGWHLDRQRFDAMLLREARRKGVDLLFSDHAPRWQARAEGGYKLQAVGTGPQDLRVRFVVDATGRQAAFATERGARKRIADRGLGFYGLFQLKPGAQFDSYALVESCSQGWWYSALLPDQRVSVGLLGDGESLRGLKRQKFDGWLSLLRTAPATWQRLQTCDFSGLPLLVLPANVGLLDQVEGGDWLAVGDAACTYDPLSSQGVLKAMVSAAAAAEALAKAERGDSNGLRAYAEGVRTQFSEHMEIRRTYYKQELRWPESAYWKNRAVAGVPVDRLL